MDDLGEADRPMDRGDAPGGCRPSVDYDRIAPSYDLRYEQHDYAGVSATLSELGEGARDVLEVGCGTGYWLDALGRRGLRVSGIDPSFKMLERARARAPDALVAGGAAEHLPFRSMAFDLVVAVNALHHFEEPAAFCGEAARVLRGGGRVVVIGLDPSAGLDDWYVYDYFGAVEAADERRYPSAEKIRVWMTAAGLHGATTLLAHRLRESKDARTCLENGTVGRHATSQLTLLDDGTYDAGVARIRRDIDAAEARGSSLSLRADLHLFATTAVAPIG